MHQHPPPCAALGYFGVAWRKHVVFGKCAGGLVAKVSPTTGKFRGPTLVEGTFAALATNIITVEVGVEASGVPTTGAKNPTAATDCCGRWWCRPLHCRCFATSGVGGQIHVVLIAKNPSGSLATT